jgi:hypothetical protein
MDHTRITANNIACHIERSRGLPKCRRLEMLTSSLNFMSELPELETWRIRARSAQVHCKAFQIGERAISQSSLVSSAQNHTGRLP